MRAVNALFHEQFNIIQSSVLDLATTGGISTPAINMRDALWAALVFIKGAGTAGDDPTITITQGDGISSGALSNAKNLTAITKIATKRHASAIPTTYTVEEQAAAATFTSLTLAEEIGHAVITITPDMLDVDNGFHAVRAAIADVGSNAQLGVLIWIVCNKYNPPLNIQADA